MDKNILYEKLHEEQQEYIEWLKSQEVDTVLDNALEFLWRQDVLMAFDAIDISDEKINALMESDNAFAELIKSGKVIRSTYDMGDIKFSIEQARVNGI